MNKPVILFEGPCAYTVKTKAGYDIRVFSTNHVTHVAAGSTTDEKRAERVCRGLNLYPRNTRQFHGLL